MSNHCGVSYDYAVLCTCALHIRCMLGPGTQPIRSDTEPAIFQPIRPCPLVRFLVFITSPSSTASLIPYFRLAVAFCSATSLLYFFFVIHLSCFVRTNRRLLSFCVSLSSQPSTVFSTALFSASAAAANSTSASLCSSCFTFSSLVLLSASPFLSSSPCCRDDSSWPPGLPRCVGHSRRCAMRSCLSCSSMCAPTRIWWSRCP